MCGIAGLILNSGEVNKENLISAVNSMKHRGPDSYGIFISENRKIGFSQTRLAIVDIDKRSDQPFSIDNGDYNIVFNGEIYNYLELQTLLKNKFNIIFKTNSDTEIIIHMFKHFKEHCLDYLKGMFSFVIYQKKKNEVFIARDHIGQKPFLYSLTKEGFYFSSEIPTLFSLNPFISKEIDYESLHLFLIDNFYSIPAPFTAFKEIKKLEFGSYMIVKNGKIIKKEKYFLLKKSKQYDLSKKPLINRIKLMEPSEVSYGVFLSGGIDSSFISANLKKNNKNIKAYTFKVGNSDIDYNRSLYVSKQLSLHQKVIFAKNMDILKSIQTTVQNNGEPYYHRTSIYSDEILKEVKKEHKVMFSGSGGDEIYYGYDNVKFLILDFYLTIKKLIPFVNVFIPKKYNFLKKSNKESLKYNYLVQNFKKRKKILTCSSSNVKNNIKIIISDFNKTVISKTYIDFSYMFGLFVENAHSITIQGDLIGMKNSVEIRSLFLERDIVENAYSIPLRHKILFNNLHEGKKILRSYMKKTFSKEFLFSKKIGFGVKSEAEKELKKNSSNLISKKVKNLSLRKNFDAKEIEFLLNDFNKNYEIIMKLYALEVWFETMV